jgi:hypothetical protein
MAEGGYEGLEFARLQTAHHIRKQAYWTQLAGGHHVYGHNESWRSPQGWVGWIGAPGSHSLKIFREILTGCAGWWDLIPDPSLLVAGRGAGSALNIAARSPVGDWILAYLSEAGSVTLRLDGLGPGRAARAWWIDPASGERAPAGIYASRRSQSFTTPQGWTDAVLFIEALPDLPG